MRRLITMPHSHFCEKARWALDYCEVAYTEEPHLLILHRLHTQRVGGGSVPVLVTDTTVFTTSAEIAAYAHDQRPRVDASHPATIAADQPAAAVRCLG